MYFVGGDVGTGGSLEVGGERPLLPGQFERDGADEGMR